MSKKPFEVAILAIFLGMGWLLIPAAKTKLESWLTSVSGASAASPRTAFTPTPILPDFDAGTPRRQRGSETGSHSPSESSPSSSHSSLPSSSSAPAGFALPSRQHFQDSPVISQLVLPTSRPGVMLEISILKINYPEPYLRMERTFEKQPDGQMRIREEVAMVSNQVLVSKPPTFPTRHFEDLLRRTNAKNIRRIGTGYLLTFSAQPQNPLAFSDLLTRVQQILPVDAVAEPNYARFLN